MRLSGATAIDAKRANHAPTWMRINGSPFAVLAAANIGMTRRANTSDE